MRVMERIQPGTRLAGPENIELPAGYEIEPLAVDLNYPTSVSWDPDGFMLIAESRFLYGRSAPSEVRILRREHGGMLQPLIGGFNGSISDIAVYAGLLYVSHRGAISVVENGRIRDVITGLPSWGLHRNSSIVFDPHGRMFFGQGSVTNSGIVGDLPLMMLQQARHQADHDIPGSNIVLRGVNYEVPNPVTRETRLTGAFAPWGTATSRGQRVAGARSGQAASGAIMSANRDGSDLRVHAWGFRNPFGLAFGPDGRLYATNNGAGPLPPRRVQGDQDALWLVEEGTWYGWPDYCDGRPITDPAFRAPDGPPQEFLIANHDELLKGESAPPAPLVTFGTEVTAGKLDFCLHPEFGFHNQAFVASSGPLEAPVGGAPPDMPAGRRVLGVDPAQRTMAEFASNRNGLPPSRNGNQGGLERPVEAKFGPDGNLFIVDYGIVDSTDQGWEATAGTGIVWRVRHTGRPGC